MYISSKKPEKKLAGRPCSKLIILALMGIMLCSMITVFIGLELNLNRPLPTNISTLSFPDSDPITPVPTSTPTVTATSTSVPEPTPTPTKGVAQPPDTTENIHVALIFNYQVDHPQDDLGQV